MLVLEDTIRKMLRNKKLKKRLVLKLNALWLVEEEVEEEEKKGQKCIHTRFSLHFSNSVF